MACQTVSVQLECDKGPHRKRLEGRLHLPFSVEFGNCFGLLTLQVQHNIRSSSVKIMFLCETVLAFLPVSSACTNRLMFSKNIHILYIKPNAMVIYNVVILRWMAENDYYMTQTRFLSHYSPIQDISFQNVRFVYPSIQ